MHDFTLLLPGKLSILGHLSLDGMKAYFKMIFLPHEFAYGLLLLVGGFGDFYGMAVLGVSDL